MHSQNCHRLRATRALPGLLALMLLFASVISPTALAGAAGSKELTPEQKRCQDIKDYLEKILNSCPPSGPQPPSDPGKCAESLSASLPPGLDDPSNHSLTKLLEEFKNAAKQCNELWSQVPPPQPPLPPCKEKSEKYYEVLYATCCKCKCEEACEQVHRIAYWCEHSRCMQDDGAKCREALSKEPCCLPLAKRQELEKSVQDCCTPTSSDMTGPCSGIVWLR
jgi:hypothetical protein